MADISKITVGTTDYNVRDANALKNYGNNASRPNGTTFTLPAGSNPVQMRSGATSGADIGIFHLSDDNAFVCNSSDNSYLFAAFDTDKTADFSSADNAAFAVLSNHDGTKIKGNLTVAGSITSGGTAVVLTNDSRMTNARPASDVYAWAKASTKPTYTYSEVGAASSGHTHATSIATSSATNQITLAANTKYAITAGGTSYVFTTPPDTNTWRPIGTGATDCAAGNHTHGLSIATSSGTNQITLAANTKYVLTAGGSTYVFTTPTDTNTWRGIQDNLTSSTNTTESLSAKQGYLLANGSARDSTKVPTTRKVNGKALSADISLTAADVGAATTDTKNTVGNTLVRDTFYLVGVTSTSETAGSSAQSYTYNGRASISGGTLYIEDLNVDGSGYFDGSLECTGNLDVGGTIKQSGTAVVLTNDSRMTNARPASDVYSWAKASTKPSYTYSEVGAASSGHTHTTSIATTSDTNQITLAASTRYKLTAGGTSYVFTTPPSGGGGGSLNLQLVRSYTVHSSSNSYTYCNFNVTVSPSYIYFIVPMLHLYSDSAYDVCSYDVNARISLEGDGNYYDTWNTIIGPETKKLSAYYEDHHVHPFHSYTDGWLYMSDPFQDDNHCETLLKGQVYISRPSGSSLELTRMHWTLNIYRICTFDPASYPMD